MRFVYNDGGRSKYFNAESVGDCVTRAIANATGIDYKEIYNRLKYLEKTIPLHKRETHGSVRDGVRKRVLAYYIEEELGWVKHSVTGFGEGVTLHLTEKEMPLGTLIVQISKHLTCVKDKVIYDTYNCSIKQYYDYDGNLITNDERAVYTYWTAPTEQQLQDRAQAKKMKELQNKAIEVTKTKIEQIKKSHQPKLTKIEKKIKELQHQLKLETNRMNREIEKMKKADGENFCNLVLSND